MNARPIRAKQARKQLGHQVGRRVFWEGPNCFNYVQNIFPGSMKKILAPSLVTGLGKSRNREGPNTISVQHGDVGDAVASPTLENWPLFGKKFWKFEKIIQLHWHLTEAVSNLPQFMFVGNRDVSPNIPLVSKTNYPKYSEITLSGVRANGVKNSFGLGYVPCNSSPDLGKGKSCLLFCVLHQFLKITHFLQCIKMAKALLRLFCL